MAQDRRGGSGLDWDRLVTAIHERNRRRQHESPSLLLARRARMWRMHDRPELSAD